MNRDSYIELDRAVASIRVGARHRTELGDLDALVESIGRLGLLQPITITPDGVLVCGVRRLAAVTRLGWHTVRVWVRAGISTRAEALLAERHENTVREPLCPSDAAALYTELRGLLAEDAAVRKEHTQFTSPTNTGTGDHEAGVEPAAPGPADSAAPDEPPPATGDARRQAAQMVTGQASYDRLDQAAEVQQLAHDPQVPPEVQRVAQQELAAMDTDGKVRGHHAIVAAADARPRLLELAHDPDQPAEVRQQAADTADRLASPYALLTSQLVTANRHAQQLLRTAHPAAENLNGDSARVADVSIPADSDGTGMSEPGSQRDTRKRPSTGARRAVQGFVMLWDELVGWTKHYDAQVIGRALDAEQWDRFCTTVRDTQEFAARAAEARDEPPTSLDSSSDRPPAA